MFETLPLPFRGPSLGELIARRSYQALAQLPVPQDPAGALLSPTADAAHTTERVAIPVGDAAMPGWLFSPKAPTGGSVVMAHGALTHAFPPYTYFTRALLKAGIRVLTIEMDGHGDNPRPLVVTGIEENVPAAVRFLADRPDVDAGRIGLLGFSLGGACSLNAAARVGGVKAMAIVAMPISLRVWPHQTLAEVASLVTFGGAHLLFDITPKHLLTFLDDQIRVAAAPGAPSEDLHMIDGRIPQVVDATLRHLRPLEHAAQLGEMPVLVAHGDWDNVVPVAHSEQLYAALRGPRELVVVPRRNHFTIMGDDRAIAPTTAWFERWL